MLRKIKVFILKYRVPPLWPTYQGERRTTFAKAYGINVRCHWELFEEHKNFHQKSTVHFPHQTQLEKIIPPSPTHKKKKEAPSLYDSTSHWLHGNSIPKIGCHNFWPGLRIRYLFWGGTYSVSYYGSTLSGSASCCWIIILFWNFDFEKKNI
jgi:hypothetical protein